MKKLLAALLCVLTLTAALSAASAAGHTQSGFYYKEDNNWYLTSVYFLKEDNTQHTIGTGSGAWIFAVDMKDKFGDGTVFEGTVGYCIQPGTGINANYESEGSRAEYPESDLKARMQQGSPITGAYTDAEILQLRRMIRLALKNGWHSTIRQGSVESNYYYALGTQMLIFEYVIGERDLTGAQITDRSMLGEKITGYYSDGIWNKVSGQCYNAVADNVSEALAVPEAITPDYVSASPEGGTVELKWDGAAYTGRIAGAGAWTVDTKRSPAGVTGKKDGSDLLLRSTKALTGEKAVYLTKTDTAPGFVILSDSQGRKTQNLIMPTKDEALVFAGTVNVKTTGQPAPKPLPKTGDPAAPLVRLLCALACTAAFLLLRRVSRKQSV